MGDLDAFIAGFVVEGRENLARFEQDLVDLERNPSSKETVSSAFRAIHNLKGAAGFLGLDRLGAVAHAGETLLSRVRGGDLGLTPAITTSLLALVDYISRALSILEETGAEGDTDHSALVARLSQFDAAPPAPVVAAPVTAPASAPTPTPDASVAPPGATNVVDAVERGEQGRSSSTAKIRVDVAQMDLLMNLVGELVLARNEMLQSPAVQQHSALYQTSQRLNAITAQLQDGIMKTRLQPIDTVWTTFPRIVRDLALQERKDVALDMEGRDTELDRSLIEAIKDPLTHLIRNAVDHGLERPDVRVAAGKPAQGRLTLRAFHEGGQVNIEVSDDGGGISVEAIRAKAIERGLIGSEQARLLSDRDALNLIFLPGFSTRDKVTTISGRGVGMDVVKTNIEAIGGKVTIQSAPGLGTTMKIRIPLTLAIMPALVVTSGKERYAIPQVNVLELLSVGGEGSSRGIERIHDAAVYRLRGELLPLVSLNAELADVAGAGSNAGTWDRLDGVANIVVLRADDRTFGLVVDAVEDTQEIVVKPLGKHLRAIAIFAGATIMGNGKVALILDPLGLAAHAQVLSGTQTADAVAPNAADAADAVQSLLVFEGPGQARMAVPLSEIVRLEEFKRSALERRGDEDVVQYRGGVLPLLRLWHVLPERRRQQRSASTSCGTNPTIHAIVFSTEGGLLGLIVDRVVDTVDQRLDVLPGQPRRGVKCSALIQERVTEVLDLPRIAEHLASAAVSSTPRLVVSAVA